MHYNLLLNQMKDSLLLMGLMDTIKDNGCTELQLPAYHPNFNPTELVWANMKA